ncbi:unnamed protein product, partial [marine sediment metagenome]
WYRYEKKTNAAGAVTGYRDDTDLGTATVDGDYSGGKVMYYVYEWNPGLTKHYIDWFAIGKYVDPEPTHTTWGPETSAEGGVLFAKFDVGQDSVELLGKFDVGQNSAELLGTFAAQVIVDLLGKAVIRQPGSVELLGKFDVGQDSAELLGKFDVGQNSAELLGTFAAQAIAELLGKFDVGQGSVEVLGKFVAQVSLNLLGKFDVGQDSAELLAWFLIPRAYSFSSGSGISFEWWGSGRADQHIDFEMWSLTGGWVGKFPDGPAE